jgi:phospholipid/cholesterol/gamma-HCH transport system permease protein
LTVPSRTAALRCARTPDGATIAFAGSLDAAGAGGIWRATMRAARQAAGRPLVLDLAAVTHCDTAGAALVLAAEAAHGSAIDLRGASEPQRALLALVRQAHRPVARSAAPPGWTYLGVLRAAAGHAVDATAYLGEVFLATLRIPARRRMLRTADLLRLTDQAGVQALPLVVLMGFLMGLILAFQSSIPLRRYGADLLVAYLVSVSLVRELGPLLAAVILAGRTGSAFAAEIGTMKVNEELDALATMGLDIVTMQVLPRLIAAALVMPVLAIVLMLAGLAGMTVVMLLFGFTPEAVLAQVQRSVLITDLLGGLFKAICFGAAVAAIGCRSGLRTGNGPRAVGQAATQAVVGGIVATILLDGFFALVFYRLNL